MTAAENEIVNLINTSLGGGGVSFLAWIAVMVRSYLKSNLTFIEKSERQQKALTEAVTKNNQALLKIEGAVKELIAYEKAFLDARSSRLRVQNDKEIGFS